jgi:hypothetical protein
VPFGGDFVAGAIAGATTWSIGEVALEYYEGDKHFNPGRVRQLYSEFYQRFRKEKIAEQLQDQARKEREREAHKPDLLDFPEYREEEKA